MVKTHPGRANKPVSLSDLAELYPRMVKHFGDRILITKGEIQ